MTKKPSEKNKAWEKDRRDRLNKTFDELAKLLPKYDVSVVWSKIEIIQKAITYITDLQKKQEDYLRTENPELLKEYEEFVDCLKFYQERNAQLTELLKKAKVSLPPLVLPQLLVDKPDLLPKADQIEIVCAQKPKRQRNRSKKNDVTAKQDEDKEEKKEEHYITEILEASPNKARSASVAQAEYMTKPTAIITAFSRETPDEPPIEIQPPPPTIPVKPLLLRLRKANSIRRHTLIPKPMFRKCYPHPDRMRRWSIDALSHRKCLPKPPPPPKRTSLRHFRPTKRVKEAEPMREQSVSPTAAFLLSFPVVTSAMLGGKNVENVENSVSLENLNNFFATEEYSKFCDQNPIADEKFPTPVYNPSFPVESADKIFISCKPMTSFTVSAITRPTSPKKSIGQEACKERLAEAPWIVENKFVQSTPTTSFESCYNLVNMNPMIGSTSMCNPSLSSTALQQVSSTQYSSANTACYSSPVTELRTSVKLEPINELSGQNKPNSTGKFFPRYIHTTATDANSSKPSLECTPKPINSMTIQSGSACADPGSWTAKSGKAIETSADCLSKTISISSSISCKISSSPTSTTDSTKMTTNPSASTLYSPTKSYFYDFPTQSQPITSASTADPLISSTTAKKSHSFLSSFPSVKPELPWLPPNTANFTMPLTPTTTTTTASTCNVNTNFTPFDLASIVSESLTSTSFAFSLSTPKSSEPTAVEAGNKLQPANKCNQMLFLPYEEAQFTPTFTFSLTKPTETQAYTTVRETPWKADKAKDIADQIFYDCEQSKPQQKSHVNWMTSPTTDYNPTSAVAPLPPIDFGNQFPTSTNFDFGFSCRKDPYDDDNQFINWSPTKPLSTDFSSAYTFENFGSNEPPPNKTVKQIFSVSQMVDQTPSQETVAIKKTQPKTAADTQKSPPAKQTFSNIYSAESLIAKKDNVTSFYNTDPSNTQLTDYQNSSNYFYNYPNTQGCLQTENDYLGASAYAAPSAIKTTSMLPPTGGTITAAPVIPPFDSTTTVPSTTNYFTHSISSNTNDPYDPTYFPSSNYNHPTTTNWSNTKSTPVNNYNQSQLTYGAGEPSCQQNSNVTGNLTNFNLSSICPEIDGKDGDPGGW